MSLFSKAEPKAKRLKMYIYGETGTGKSVTSLHFPNPAVIDTERGTEHYGDKFDFFKLDTANPVEINKAIDELLKDPQEFKTLVIDPFSNVWDAIQDMHVKRMRMKTGNPNYSLQPLDYRSLKSEVKSLITKLLALDMNIIVTAKSKPMYSPEKSEFMQVIGTQAEGPKDLPYLFDVVLELVIDPDTGQRIAKAKKDRTNKLPSEFEFSYKSFTDFLGIEGLERDPVVFEQQEAMNKYGNRNVEINMGGKIIRTAGVTAETLTKLSAIADQVGESVLSIKLKDEFFVDSLLDLKEDEGQFFLKQLTK
ncbi:AAA family ATPase [bacterium]|nr:AAA family ATPase [bacterium]